MPIHLTTGIAMISDTLPPPASDLVSRSCCPDSSDNRSPFDLIRNVLALLENDGSLTFTSETSLGVSNSARRELMVAMDKAATIFQKCTEEEPTDVDHWSWYVAALLGALCVAYDLSVNASRSYSNDDDEYQQQISVLYKLRHDASVGLTDFLKFTKLHGCPMFHFTVTTMLEWNKAIALLHRPQPTGFGLEVKKLHAYHVSLFFYICPDCYDDVAFIIIPSHFAHSIKFAEPRLINGHARLSLQLPLPKFSSCTSQTICLKMHCLMSWLVLSIRFQARERIGLDLSEFLGV